MNGERRDVSPARPYVPPAPDPGPRASSMTRIWREEEAEALRVREMMLAAAAKPPRPRRGWAEAAVRAERRLLDALGAFLVNAGTRVKRTGARNRP